MTYVTEAFIIKKKDVREADRLYDLYTRDRGKIRVLARGIRKKQSKIAPFLREHALLHVMIVRGKHQQYLAGCVIKHAYDVLQSFRLIAVADFTREMVHACLGYEQHDPWVFRHMQQLFERLEASKCVDDHLRRGARVWGMELLEHLGIFRWPTSEHATEFPGIDAVSKNALDSKNTTLALQWYDDTLVYYAERSLHSLNFF